MLWSIDSCQNKVSADQYHLSESRAQVSTHRSQVFFEVIAGSSLIFFKKIHMKYVVFMCPTIKILISNSPRTRKFSQLLQAGKTVAFPLDVQNEIQLLSGVFVYWVFGWEIRHLSRSEIRFRMASFSFSPCLMRKRVVESETILALHDTFQELYLEW